MREKRGGRELRRGETAGTRARLAARSETIRPRFPADRAEPGAEFRYRPTNGIDDFALRAGRPPEAGRPGKAYNAMCSLFMTR